MKTQISNLINGSENTMRDIANSKYANNPIGFFCGNSNMPQLGGTPTAIRKAVADKIGAENPEAMHISIRGVDLTLARINSTTGKSWRWESPISAEQYTFITGIDAPIWTHAGAQNEYGIIVNGDCTVEVFATSGKKGLTTIIGEEFIEIL